MEDLQRKEYPATLGTLQPHQAVAILNERVKRISKVNIEIADWLSERRKVEEAYVAGLKKLARRPLPDANSELGIFLPPWQKIVASTEAIAHSHQTFASRIEKDVESPLRTYSAKNRELQAMTTMQGNVSAMARELEEAQDRVDKLSKKGGKANATKVDQASTKLESATAQWDSQAPFVFESLQAADETRLNHLRDVLTQYETHEADKVERNRLAAEQVLNSLLELDTAVEIASFATNATQGKPKLERRTVRPSTSSVGSNSLMPPPPAPPSEDNASDDASGRLEPIESKGGLKRLGTMLGRRRQSMHGGFARATSPSKGFTPFNRSSSSREGRPSPSPRASVNNLRENTTNEGRLESLAEAPNSPIEETGINGATNGIDAGKPKVNGNDTTSPDLSGVEPPSGPPPSQKDSEGFSAPPTAHDPISLAQAEAAETNDAPQFKLDIMNEPIQEEETDAQAALSNVANTLRSNTLVTPSRKLGTVRGRRDVRNTIYIPSPETSEASMPATPPYPMIGKLPSLPSLPAHDTMASIASSDTQSIRSSHSLTGASVVKHPELHQPGLSASIVESINAVIENGTFRKVTATGELALAYNSPDAASSLFGETVRINNFQALEAIAPNHGFVNEVSGDRPGEYSVDVSNLSKTAVAFKYKVHVDETNMSAIGPVLFTVAWRPQGDKLGLVIDYKLNPAYSTTPITVHNLVLVAVYEGGRAAGAQTKPSGTHLKDRSLIYWRLGDVTLDGTSHKVVARLIGAEGTELKPGIAEARWELTDTLISDLGISRLEANAKGKETEESSDPFADQSVSPGLASPAGPWTSVETVKKTMSGKYDAVFVAPEAI